MDPLNAFANQQYMNLETFRKSGEGVSTPVWFVALDNELCFTTEPASGKVKRMRRDPRVRVAPCKVNGELLGDWHDGKARFLSPEEIPAVEKVYSRKYGIQKMFFDLFGRARRQGRVFIAVSLETGQT
jgi:PPOX class probable F420-dependent enzyme